MATTPARATSSERSASLLIWLALYVGAVTLAFTISHGPGDLHNDVLEAYAWGRELQAGYHKHPPFWAWVAYAWFSVFPSAGWSGYLLGACNAAAGLGCTFLIGRRFLTADKAAAAVLGLMTTTMYVCFAERFNANAILLSLWPATALAVLRAAEARTIASGILAGVLVGLCILSKYQSVTFLAALLAAIHCLHRGERVFLNRAALACVLTAVAVTARHFVWLVQSGGLPLRYAESVTHRPWIDAASEVAMFPVISAVFLAPAVLIYAAAAGWTWRQMLAAVANPFAGVRGSVAVLAFGPVAITMLLCLAASSTLKPVYTTPLFFMVPVWLAMTPLPVGANLLRRARQATALVFGCMLIVSPVIARIAFQQGAAFMARPKAEIAAAVTAEWHDRFHTPLSVVGGTEDYALAAPLYSSDHPSYLIGLDRKVLNDFGMQLGGGPTDVILAHSPWITRERIAAQGLAIICSQEPRRISFGCDDEAARWIGPHGETAEMTVAKHLFGRSLPAYRFRIYFRPPEASHDQPSAGSP